MGTSHLKWIFLIMAMTFLLPVSSRAQAGYATVKVYNLHPKPVVKAMINGKQAYLLLDTGSDIDLLHSKEEKKYNFSIFKKYGESKEILVTVNGMERNFGHIYNLNLMIGEKRISGNFISMDIGSIVTSIRNKTGVTISGIIGSGTMKNHCFVIDYENEVIVMKSGID